ncbi:MAG: DMT family transporter [Steroidobacteraceae bacterium]
MTARAWLVFLGLGIVWGLPYLFIKLAVRELSPCDVAWGRITLAALLLAPLAWRRGTLTALRTHTAAICAFALLEFVLPYWLIAASERWIPSSVAGILICGVPLATVPAARWFGLHEPLGARRLSGLLGGVLGVAVLIGFGSITGLRSGLAVAGMVFVTLCYATGPMVVQRHLHEVDSLGALAASLLVASGVLAIPAALTLPAHIPSALALGSVAFLGAICTAVSMLGMFYLIKLAGAARTAVVTYINPIIAAALGVLVLHERIGWSGPLGLILILLSVWLATHGAPPARTPAAEPG